MKIVPISPHISFANSLPFGLIAGPCVLEGHQHALEIAQALVEMCERLSIPFIFKASFDKANRTSLEGARGMDWEQAALIFQDIRQKYGCPILTDVHEPNQCTIVAETVDILQIPALLCRQTDLIKAAAETRKVIHIKKGQFLSPEEMCQVVKKAEKFGNTHILICERGTSFGYNRLINDMRALPTLASTGYPVVFDATHSVQLPGGLGTKSGGERHFVEALARAAIAVGVAGVFMETHPDPEKALSDGPNMVPLSCMESLLHTLKGLDTYIKQCPYNSFSRKAYDVQKASKELYSA